MCGHADYGRMVAKRAFDRKFGSELIAQLPTTPAVYLFKGESGEVLYVGKAKNIRRRLSSYRHASRRNVHRKMRRLVREASSVEVRHQDSEQAALLIENELIRTLRPTFNVEGAFSFLYPAVGLGRVERTTVLCFTTHIDAWNEIGLRWFGCFRSRTRAKEAFDALAELLSWMGHIEKRSALPSYPRIRGSRLVGLRQLPAELSVALAAMFAGESNDALKQIARLLLEKPRARRDAKQVQANIEILAEFYEQDIVALRDAMLSCGQQPGFVQQAERDALFIRARETGRLA
jgi:hypothetical protein